MHLCFLHDPHHGSSRWEHCHLLPKDYYHHHILRWSSQYSSAETQFSATAQNILAQTKRTNETLIILFMLFYPSLA